MPPVAYEATLYFISLFFFYFGVRRGDCCFETVTRLSNRSGNVRVVNSYLKNKPPPSSSRTRPPAARLFSLDRGLQL